MDKLIRLTTSVGVLLFAAAVIAHAADNSTLPVSGGGTEVFANKEIGGVKFPKHILYDTAGAAIGSSNPLAVTLPSTQITPLGGAGSPPSTGPAIQGLGPGSTPVIVGGDAASAAGDTGSPVKIGGVFNTTQTTVTTGQRTNAAYTARGAAIVAPGVENFLVQNQQYLGAARLTSASVSFSSSGDNTVVTRTTGTVKIYRLKLACATPVAVTIKDGASTSLTGAMTLSTLYDPFEGEPHYTTTGTNNFVVNLGSAVQCSGRVYYIES